MLTTLNPAFPLSQPYAPRGQRKLASPVSLRFAASGPPAPPSPSVGEFLWNLFRGRYDRAVGTVVKVAGLALLSAFIGFAASGRLTAPNIPEDPHDTHHSSHGDHDAHGGHHDDHHDAGGHGDGHGPEAGGHGAGDPHDDNGHHDMNAELDKFLRRKKHELEHYGRNPYEMPKKR